MRRPYLGYSRFLRRFAGGQDSGYHLSYRDFNADSAGHVGEHTGGRRFDFNRGLIGFDLDQWLAFCDFLALVFEPAQYGPGFLRYAQRW